MARWELAEGGPGKISKDKSRHRHWEPSDTEGVTDSWARPGSSSGSDLSAAVTGASGPAATAGVAAATTGTWSAAFGASTSMASAVYAGEGCACGSPPGSSPACPRNRDPTRLERAIPQLRRVPIAAPSGTIAWAIAIGCLI